MGRFLWKQKNTLHHQSDVFFSISQLTLPRDAFYRKVLDDVAIPVNILKGGANPSVMRNDDVYGVGDFKN